MLNKSLNHKSIIAAFEEAYKEFSQMPDADFQSMIRDTELASLGSLLYQTNTVAANDETHMNIVIDVAPIARFEHKSYAPLKEAAKPVSIDHADNYLSFLEEELWLKAA